MGVHKGFLDKVPKAQETKPQMDGWDYKELKASTQPGGSPTQWRERPQDGGMFVDHTSDKGLMSYMRNSKTRAARNPTTQEASSGVSQKQRCPAGPGEGSRRAGEASALTVHHSQEAAQLHAPQPSEAAKDCGTDAQWKALRPP